ncbi:Hypothetical protein A7982_10850 [Minicystis rosea]|nr:Hypothetical protein A7982_10850 [Minicystis rosea]
MTTSKTTHLWASPEGALVLLAAIGTAILAKLPIVLLPGVLAYGILVFLRRERRKAQESAEDLAPIASDLTHLDPPYAARVDRAETLARTILGELASTLPEHRLLLAGTADRVRHLAASSARIAARMQDLDRHLHTIAPADVERSALEWQARSASDPVAREGYARALAQQAEKQQVYEELGARRERLDAQLVGVEKTLETAAAQVIRIKSADLEGAPGARVTDAIDALAVDLSAAAETVDEAAAYEQSAKR